MLQAAHVCSRTDTFASQPIPAGVVAEYSGISGCMHRCDSTSVMTESQSSAGQKVHFPLLSVSSFMDSVLIGNLAGSFLSVSLGGKSLM